MGKYMRRKAKTTGDVDVSQSSLGGVRTRAKILALQRLPDSCYLELRSRRLQKKPPVVENNNNSPKKEEIEIEPSFGENNLELEPRARSTRESTPCSLIKPADDITAPGSSTKQRTSPDAKERSQNALLRNIPTARDMEEFFAQAEKSQQRIFMDKYNFDVVNDVPLPGRYEWVKVE